MAVGKLPQSLVLDESFGISRALKYGNGGPILAGAGCKL